MSTKFELSTNSFDMNCYLNLKPSANSKLIELITPQNQFVIKGKKLKKYSFDIQNDSRVISYRYSKNEFEKEANERFYQQIDGKPYPEIWNKQRIILSIQTIQNLPQNFQFYYICEGNKEKLQLQYNFLNNQYEIHIQQKMTDAELKLKIENLQFETQKYQELTVILDKKHFKQYRNAYKIEMKQNEFDLLSCIKQQVQIVQKGMIKVVERKIENANLQHILQFVESLLDYNEKIQNYYLNAFENQFSQHHQIMNNINPKISQLQNKFDQLSSCIYQIDQECQNMKLKHEKLFIFKTTDQKQEPIKQIFSSQVALEPRMNTQNPQNNQLMYQLQKNVDKSKPPQVLGIKDKTILKSNQKVQMELDNIEEYSTDMLKFSENLVKYKQNFELMQKQILDYQQEISELKETINQCNQRIKELQKQNKQLLEQREENQCYIIKLIRNCSRKFVPTQVQTEKSQETRINCQLENFNNNNLVRCNSQKAQLRKYQRIIKQCSKTPKKRQNSLSDLYN